MLQHQEATIQCKSCPRMFVTESMMNRHHKQVHEDYKPYKCEICGKGCNSKYNLQIHSVVHTGEKPYTCDQCGNSYTQKSHLKTHIKKAHEGVKMKKYIRQKVMCPQCGKMFQAKSKLRVHIKVVHEGIPIEELGVAASNHNRNQQLACGKCDKRFFNKQSLRTHERQHTTTSVEERKTLPCPSCPLMFTLPINLKRHIKRVHEGIKNHQCDVCEKKFASKNEVKEHMTMHTGEKAYKCEECGKAFSQLSSLYGHRKKSHKEKESYIQKEPSFMQKEPSFLQKEPSFMQKEALSGLAMKYAPPDLEITKLP